MFIFIRPITIYQSDYHADVLQRDKKEKINITHTTYIKCTFLKNEQSLSNFFNQSAIM